MSTDIETSIPPELEPNETPLTLGGIEAHIGKNIFIRTLTNYYTGRILGVTAAREVVLVEAAWISVTGRFGTMMVEGPKCINECEPYPASLRVYVNREAIVDWNPWNHDLPREQTS